LFYFVKNSTIFRSLVGMAFGDRLPLSDRRFSHRTYFWAARGRTCRRHRTVR
jgi:hypothetical protein